MTDLGAQSAEGADVRGLPECCAGEGYPGIAHDLLSARRERDELREALRQIAGFRYTLLADVLLVVREVQNIARAALRDKVGS